MLLKMAIDVESQYIKASLMESVTTQGNIACLLSLAPPVNGVILTPTIGVITLSSSNIALDA